MSATWGHHFSLTIFGESHGPAIGVVVNGIPAGTVIDRERIRFELGRRQPASAMSTARKEPDEPEILSGVRDGRASGAPLMALFRNSDTRSGDYENLRHLMRPGHADFAAHIKHHGFNDRRGGGHFSGRLTAALVFGGAIAKLLLEEEGIKVFAHAAEIGGIADTPFDPVAPALPEGFYQSALPVIDKKAAEKMLDAVKKAAKEEDSLGGIIECAATGLPAGVGEPFFESMESALSGMLFSVPAVKGIEFGAGFAISRMKGSGANDALRIRDGAVVTRTNNNGGINGGITNGMPLLLRCAIKPTPSVAVLQDTVDIDKMENARISVLGRHDACIVPRAVPVIEAAVASVVYDMLRRR